MNTRRMFRPDLDDCVLEDRLAPVIANLGVVVLTTSGYMLLIPFPGSLVTPYTGQQLRLVGCQQRKGLRKNNFYNFVVLPLGEMV